MNTAAASNTAGATLLNALLTELRMQSPRFATMNEDDQQLVIDRLRNTVEGEIDLLVARIACRSFPAGAAKIAKMTIGDGEASLTVRIPSTMSMLHDLTDRVGRSCWLVLCDPEEFTGGMQAAVKPLPNQQSLLPPEEGEPDGE